MCDIKRKKDIGKIKKSIEEKMEELFEKAHKYTENLSHEDIVRLHENHVKDVILLYPHDLSFQYIYEDIVRLHENHVKDVFYAYINNIPSLQKIVVEIGEEKVLEEIKSKFMANFHFHEKMVKCEELRDDRKTKYTEEEILENNKKISKYIDEVVTSIIQECRDLNTEEIKEIHIFIFKLIFQSDIEHIPCFKSASKTMNIDVINRIHDRKITETISKYISMIKEN